MFIDEVTLKLMAGKGGDGVTSFRHEKYVPLGGPDGGSGGNGGNIIFIGEEGIKTLIDLRYKKIIKGKDGSNGEGSNKKGSNGENTYIKVPIGTTVYDITTNLIICDITKHNEEYIAAKGGTGGKGNASFKSNINKAPQRSEFGLPGEERIVRCELKLIADVGLIGYPSVGKSSLINVLTNAKAKVGSYNFTTLSPNLGVAKFKKNSFIIADLPGLIKGASEGIGLGDKFLRHAVRTKILAHVIDMSGIYYNPIESYKVIEEEIKKYKEKLYLYPKIIIANKMDIPSSKENLIKFKKEIKDIEIIPVSAITKYNIDTLLHRLNELVKINSTKPYEENEFENYVLYEYKEEKPYEIIKSKNNTWIIKGKNIENLLKKTKFNSEEAILNFANILKKIGVDKSLKELGAKEGETVKILDYEFTYKEKLN